MRVFWLLFFNSGKPCGLNGANRVGKICLNSIVIFTSVSAGVLKQKKKVSGPDKDKAWRCYVHERVLWSAGFENSPLLLCFISAEQLLKASVLEALEVSCRSSDRDHVVEGVWNDRITQVSARNRSSLSAWTLDLKNVWEYDLSRTNSLSSPATTAKQFANSFSRSQDRIHAVIATTGRLSVLSCLVIAKLKCRLFLSTMTLLVMWTHKIAMNWQVNYVGS